MRVLVAEDDPISRRMVSGLLEKIGCTVSAVDNGLDAWRALESEDSPQIAILDWGMPGLSGTEICRRLRALEAQTQRYVYTILVTARDSQEDLIAGLEAGADDYIRKPFDPQELRVRLNTGKRIQQLRAELLAAQQLLERRARYDALTEVLNRGAVTERLCQELARARRHGETISICMIDIDHFKRVNDTSGHRAGDAVLRECVRRIKSCIRPYDEIGRLGGEEFLLITPGALDAGAFAIFNRARSVVEASAIVAYEERLEVTISGGAAESKPDSTPDMLLHEADEALYRAKRSGRNQIARYTGAAG